MSRYEKVLFPHFQEEKLSIIYFLLYKWQNKNQEQFMLKNISSIIEYIQGPTKKFKIYRLKRVLEMNRK